MALFLASATVLSGCGKDDDHHHPGHEQELITTVGLFLTHPTDSTLNTSITFRDLDGEGGQNGVFYPDTLHLQPNVTYRSWLLILDQSDPNPANSINIGEEIKEESDVHQFFYTPTAGLNITVTNLNLDANQMPLGLEADIITGQASTGALRVSLSHYGEVAKDGINPSGETDIEVNFPVRIQQ